MNYYCYKYTSFCCKFRPSNLIHRFLWWTCSKKDIHSNVFCWGSFSVNMPSHLTHSNTDIFCWGSFSVHAVGYTTHWNIDIFCWGSFSVNLASYISHSNRDICCCDRSQLVKIVTDYSGFWCYKVYNNLQDH